jgi:sugar phosphate isomerase/epimerase
MIPAIWTDFVPDEPLPDKLAFFHASGWTCLELSTEDIEELSAQSDPQPRIEATKSALERLGITMPQAHAFLHADVAHPDEKRRKTDLRTLQQHLDFCAKLSVENVVIHPGGRGYTTDEELSRVFALNVEAFTLLGNQAGELGLKIGIENMFAPPGRNTRVFGSSVAELLDLIAAVDSPALGITFDTSHANVEKLDLGAAIREFGDLLCCTHISDNDGSDDHHRIPGFGTIDWHAVMSAFRDIGYDGILNLEIPGDSHPDRELRLIRSRYAREVAGWLIDTA